MLTSYDLSCGYVETKIKNGFRHKLYREHGTYHVMIFDENSGKRIEWNSYRLLTEARKDFRQKRNHILDWEKSK
jgi:hypothetical protein